VTRAINPSPTPMQPPTVGQNRERVSRAEPQTKPGSSSSSSSSEAKSALGTSTAVPTQPNAPREDAGRQGQGSGQGGAGGGHAGDAQLAKALNGQAGGTAIAKAVVQLTSMANGETLVGLGKDSVLLNIGPAGRHTFATGSLIPRKYLRHYHKLTMGRRTDPWEEDDREDTGPSMTAEEYELLVNEMAQARMNGRRSVLQAAQRLPHRQKAKTG